MYQKNKRYQALHSRNQEDERNNRITHGYCRLCNNRIDIKQDIFHYVKDNALLCTPCLHQFHAVNVKTRIDAMELHILYEYNDFLENMLFQFKEGRDIALRDVFFHEVISQIERKFRHYAILLLPSSREKMIERGFLPVKEMLRHCRLPIFEPFYKNRDHKQSLQSFAQRKQIDQVIKKKDDITLPNKKLLLVDDVCTSGATLSCAYQLLKEHTYKIEALVLCAHPLFIASCKKDHTIKRDTFSMFHQ